uniref:TOG domain-containing protein n=1 Tax=Chromera velia CCMP2878 TaxID=1169474 RepID=A0A0G4HWC2_9ALVE|eukprot:Cvel_9017.t1-p1 / transcript=Cvel_9017.t1 / gene=Cvel_9017 / organism=Chromera_velia_CCMP2878 / gene_product=Centrosomal protein of 104 kDa, putative / transcript_product=Centrosomal protein of 104 kDa, putative / location=Cvel_scaffold510:64258-74077(-) / protein_length=1010 / sequence_SO=supercontig / SO=protein_coding / is_pseudo=false
MSAVRRVNFSVVEASSEDPEYPVHELLVHSSATRGWQSMRFCNYPQELGLKFDHPVRIKQLQFLSHQSKITSKIELFTAFPDNYETAHYRNLQFTRLGYLSLDSNERSAFQARELKSVYVDVDAVFLKVLLHRNHLNRFNLTNQVGLVALSVQGYELPPISPPRGLSPVGSPRRTHQASNGAALMPPTVGVASGAVWANTQSPSPERASPASAASSRGQIAQQQMLAAQAPPTATVGATASARALLDDLQFDTVTNEQLRGLQVAKRMAVDREDYTEAARCKEAIDRLRAVGHAISQLESRKRLAVAEERFSQAANFKLEIDRLRASITNPREFAAVSASLGVPEPQGGTTSRGRSPRERVQERETGGHSQRNTDAGRDESQRGDESVGKVSAGGRPVSPEKGLPESEGLGGMGAGGGGEEEGSPGGEREEEPQNRAARGPGEGGQIPRTPQRPRAVPPPNPAPSSPSPSSVPGGDRERERGGPTGGGGGGGLPSNSKHPLAGVPKIEELPPPEPLEKLTEGNKDAEAVAAVLGDYLTRCLYSKNWQLREAAILKLDLEVTSGKLTKSHNESDPLTLLHCLCQVLKRCLPDRIAQVVLVSAQLVQSISVHMLGGVGGGGGLGVSGIGGSALRRVEVQSALDPVLPLLVDRLGDGHGRIRDAAATAIITLAKSPLVGGGFLGQQLLQNPKKKSAPSKVIVARLQVLQALTLQQQCLQPLRRDGIPVDALLQQTMEWFQSPHSDIRLACVSLVGAVFHLMGAAPVEPFLDRLRPAQKGMFLEEFERRAAESEKQERREGRAPPRIEGIEEGNEEEGRWGETGGDSDGHPGGMSPLGPYSKGSASAKYSAGRSREDLGSTSNKTGDGDRQARLAGASDETLDLEDDGMTCRFCLLEDEEFGKAKLEIHWWLECPMLFSCHACEQVIEFWDLMEHREAECGNTTAFEKCDRCQLLFEEGEMNRHKAEGPCRPPEVFKENGFPSRCHLCGIDLVPSVEGYLKHYTKDICPRNPRN